MGGTIEDVATFWGEELEHLRESIGWCSSYRQLFLRKSGEPLQPMMMEALYIRRLCFKEFTPQKKSTTNSFIQVQGPMFSKSKDCSQKVAPDHGKLHVFFFFPSKLLLKVTADSSNKGNHVGSFSEPYFITTQEPLKDQRSKHAILNRNCAWTDHQMRFFIFCPHSSCFFIFIFCFSFCFLFLSPFFMLLERKNFDDPIWYVPICMYSLT